MQARITRFKMREDAVEAASGLMHQLEAEIMAQPGVGRCIVVINPDGSGYVVVLIDEEGSSAEAVDGVRRLWHRFHDHLEAVPDPEIFEVIADWGG